MSTIHTNLVGSTAKIKAGADIPAYAHRGKEGEIVAAYMGSDSLPRFLLAMNPSTSHKSKHPLVEVVWSDLEWVKQSEKKVLLCE